MPTLVVLHCEFPSACLPVCLSSNIFFSDWPLASIQEPDITTVIGIEATHYLKCLLEEPKTAEPLLAALGGEPFSLKAHIEKDLQQYKAHGLRPFFVFEGTKIGNEVQTMRMAKEALVRTEDAWQAYYNDQAMEAVSAFGSSGEPCPYSTSMTLLIRVRRCARAELLRAPTENPR